MTTLSPLAQKSRLQAVVTGIEGAIRALEFTIEFTDRLIYAGTLRRLVAAKVDHEARIEALTREIAAEDRPS